MFLPVRLYGHKPSLISKPRLISKEEKTEQWTTIEGYRISEEASWVMFI